MNTESNLANKLLKVYNIFLPPASIILELGARNCSESVLLNKLFTPEKLYTFECNPATLPLCRATIKDYPNIILTEKAVTNKTGTITFFPTNPEKTITTWKDGNPGASSLFKASGKYPVETYVQDEITVACTTLADFINEKQISNIDILWMDIQGSELNALKSAGQHLHNIKLIHTEVEFCEIYEGQPLFDDINNFLKDDFELLGFTSLNPQYIGDAVYINKKLSNDKLCAEAKKHLMQLTTTRKIVSKVKNLVKQILFKKS